MKYSVFSGVLPELTAEQVVETVSRHGYHGVEWRVNEEYHFKVKEIDREAARIKELCDAHGLEVSSMATYVRLEQEDDIRRLADAADIMGCPCFRLFSALYDPAVGYWALFKEALAKLWRAERILARAGVRGLLEVHFGTIVCSPSLAHELVRRCDPNVIGVILDPANMVIEGSMNLRMGLDILKDYIHLVHVKNARWEQTPEGKWRWRFDDLKEGALDWADAIAALKAIGYDGYLSFENLYRVPMTHKGYIAEDLGGDEEQPRDIDERLASDLAYIRGLVEGGR